MKKKFLILTILLLVSQIAFAATVNDITAPITKIYDLIKGIVAVIGIIAITIAGAMYMFSGANIQQRENAKSMVSMKHIIELFIPLMMGLLLFAPYMQAASSGDSGGGSTIVIDFGGVIGAVNSNANSTEQKLGETNNFFKDNIERYNQRIRLRKELIQAITKAEI